MTQRKAKAFLVIGMEHSSAFVTPLAGAFPQNEALLYG
jgi:hypothetical protein